MRSAGIVYERADESSSVDVRGAKENRDKDAPRKSVPRKRGERYFNDRGRNFDKAAVRAERLRLREQHYFR